MSISSEKVERTTGNKGSIRGLMMLAAFGLATFILTILAWKALVIIFRMIF